MKILKNIVVGLIIFSMFLFCGPSFAAQDYGYAKIDKALIGKTGTVNVIIITGDKTVVDYVGNLSYSNKFFQGTIESCINNSVESVYLRCKSISPDLTKRWVFNTVINGFSCEVDASKLIDLAKLPSVKKIVDATFRYEMQINKHLPYLGVTKLRQIGTPDGKKATGAGIRVGVIDSGINYKHLALGDGWGRRVKFGYDFADKDSDPLDFMGHGSHCAGIIGANGKYLDTPITGVAPEATFGAYKVFTVDEGRARPDNVAAALEMAAKDKCAVANMSLGRALYYGGENAVEDEAIKNATKAGMLVVVAAGNDGYRSDRLPLPIGVPAVTEEALCVAATDERGKCLIEVMTKTGETKKMLANNHIWGLPSINPDDALYE
ncbi:MAG TPA: S8 family serine peptidase, partial [Caldisericia bacterium]|nr:S8 family serine peptidase [Caldisericia bacterium]